MVALYGLEGCSGEASVNEPVLDRAVDLVGRHLEVAQPALARGLEQHVRALHVGHDERLGPGDRAVDVGLGGEVDDRVAARDRVGDGRRILDRAVHEPDLVDHVVEVLPAAPRT